MLVQDPDVLYNRVIPVVRDSKRPFIVYDLETEGLNPYQGDRLIGVAIKMPYVEEGEGESPSFYLPFRHREGKNLPIECLYPLAPALADSERALVGWNLNFDKHFTEIEGMAVHAQPMDGMLAAHLNNENEMSLALKHLGSKYIDPSAAKADQELAGKLKERKLKKGQMKYLPPEDVASYAIQDVDLTWDLTLFLRDALQVQGLEEIWYEVNEYSKAVYKMEKYGTCVNIDRCKEFMAHADRMQKELCDEMFRIAGKEFNPRSVPQLQKILKRKKTDKESLKTCDHPVAPLLLKYRSWQKANGSFYSKLVEKCDHNFRVHPNLWMTGTISSRLSCTDPNLQALPKRSDIYKVRHLIVAPPGYELLSIDYSQAEMRVLAHYTGDPFLVDVYVNNKDIHSATAEVIRKDREKAKRTNYGIVYGIGVEGLANDLGVPSSEAREILDRYHGRMPSIRKLYRACENYARKHKHINFWTGRRRHYGPEDYTHKAMSNLIQGAVAEIMRHAITRLDRFLIGTRVRIILQVHDEVLFEIPEGEMDYWYPKIKTIMENFSFKVPILTDAKRGYSWGEMQELEVEQRESA